MVSSADILKELKNALRELYGERLVGIQVFGSQARGDATSESNIDVLVVLEGEIDAGSEIARTGSVIAHLSLEHNVVLSPLFLSADRYENERSPLLLNIHREGLPI